MTWVILSARLPVRSVSGKPCMIRKWPRSRHPCIHYCIARDGVLLGTEAVHSYHEEEPKLARVAAFFQFPIGSAVVLSVIVSIFIYQDSPRLLNAILGIAAIGFGVFVLRKLVAPPLDLLLYALLGLFFLDRLREIAHALPLTTRLVFSFELMAASVFLFWFYRSKKVAAKVAAGDVAVFQKIHRLLPIVASILLIALVANVVGLVDLSLLLGGTVLRSSYLALVLYTAAQILNSAIAFALRVEPFTRLNAVRTSRSLIRANIMRAVNWAAIFIWLIAVLRMLALQDRVFGIYQRSGRRLLLGH